MKIKETIICISLAVYTIYCSNNVYARDARSYLSSTVSKTPANTYSLQLNEILNLIDNHYVNKITDQRKQEIISEGFNKILNSLDRYSEYMYGEDLENFNGRIAGKFGGIGVVIANSDKKVKVISLLKDGPAIQSGVKAGDEIVIVDNHKVEDLNYDIRQKIRGLPGTKVMLTVARDNGDLHEYQVTREWIEVRAAKYHFTNGILYIRLSIFNQSTDSELKKIFEQLNPDAIQGIIFDLRGNPGGLLDQAIKVVDLFIDSGVVLKCINRNKQERLFYATPYSFKVPNVPVITLIDSKSASASEVVAGALQYYKRAVVVGTKSFGKASVQDIFSMQNANNPAKVKITTAYYYTPGGEMIHNRGIIPNVEVEYTRLEDDNTIDYQHEIIDNTTNLISDEEIQYLSKDSQYKRALEILREKLTSSIF